MKNSIVVNNQMGKQCFERPPRVVCPWAGGNLQHPRPWSQRLKRSGENVNCYESILSLKCVDLTSLYTIRNWKFKQSMFAHPTIHTFEPWCHGHPAGVVRSFRRRGFSVFIFDCKNYYYIEELAHKRREIEQQPCWFGLPIIIIVIFFI